MRRRFGVWISTNPFVLIDVFHEPKDEQSCGLVHYVMVIAIGSAHRLAAMTQITDNVAIITGGSGPNIGRGISQNLADTGFTVVILDIDTDGGNEVVETIRDRGGEAMFIETDVTNVEAIHDATETVVDTYGRIDVLVNSAGSPAGVTIDSIGEKEFDVNIERNLKSSFFCTKAALPHLQDNSGSVVFVSSVNALVGGFSEIGYATAKGGLHALCRCLVADYSEFGIRFNVVCPGSIIGNSVVWREREEKEPGTLDSVAEMYPLKRYGEPEDVANAVRFLISEEAEWINGIVMPVDGGLTATGNLPGGRWWEQL